MSTTFYVHPSPEPTSWTLACWDHEATTGEQSFATEPAARTAAANHAVTCEPCSAYGPLITPVTDVPEINVSNSNARQLLDVLGYTGDGTASSICGSSDASAACYDELSGQTSGPDFLGRVLTALALAPVDAGVPAHAVHADSRFIDCGRRPGYIQDRLVQLEELSRYASTRGLLVTWG